MSNDIPMFIKRRLSSIEEALEHAMSPNSVIQPEEYSDGYEYVKDVIYAVIDELEWDTFNDNLSELQSEEIVDYLKEYHFDEIIDYYRMYVDDDEDEY
jgi:hypothetical protein